MGWEGQGKEPLVGTPLVLGGSQDSTSSLGCLGRNSVALPCCVTFGKQFHFCLHSLWWSSSLGIQEAFLCHIIVHCLSLWLLSWLLCCWRTSELKLSLPWSPAFVCQVPPREILYSAGWWTPAEPACSGTEVDVCSADPRWLPSNCLGVSVRRRHTSKWVQGMWSRQSAIDPSGYALCWGGLGFRVQLLMSRVVFLL